MSQFVANFVVIFCLLWSSTLHAQGDTELYDVLWPYKGICRCEITFSQVPTSGFILFDVTVNPGILESRRFVFVANYGYFTPALCHLFLPMDCSRQCTTDTLNSLYPVQEIIRSAYLENPLDFVNIKMQWGCTHVNSTSVPDSETEIETVTRETISRVKEYEKLYGFKAPPSSSMNFPPNLYPLRFFTYLSQLAPEARKAAIVATITAIGWSGWEFLQKAAMAVGTRAGMVTSFILLSPYQAEQLIKNDRMVGPILHEEE